MVIKIVFSKLNLILFKKAWLLLIISALVILAIGQYTNIDLIIEDYYYNDALKTFPWRESWFARDLMHGYVKRILVNSGYVLYPFLLFDIFKPIQKLKPMLRMRLRFVALSSILIPLIIRGSQNFSVFHCPWSIDRYGGTQPFVRLLEHMPAGVKISHCFPAAHATVGLWLASLCIFWLPQNPKIASGVFFSGLGVGLFMGWVQQMRGAHFLFHTLWSAWLASLIILIMLQFTFTTFNKDAKYAEI
jgi:membrane-associated PAP2 superfamily phosphatase